MRSALTKWLGVACLISPSIAAAQAMGGQTATSNQDPAPAGMTREQASDNEAIPQKNQGDRPSQGLEEIVVTAQKRAENLQDVPISITALNDAALEARGISGIGDLIQVPPPGVFLQPFAGGQTLLTIDVRGISNSDPGQGTTELGTPVYIDDVYLGRAQGLGADLADPERIEILRGPQGTLFGRNAEGGAIRIVTKKPTGEFGGEVKAMVGNYDQRRFEAHLNLPAFAGFAVKLDYLNNRRGGFTKNGPRLDYLDRQQDFGKYSAEGVRGSVRWQPFNALTVDYAYDWSRSDDSYDYFVLASPPGGPPPAVANGTFASPRPLDRIDRRTDRSWIPLYQEPFVTKVSGHTLQAELELGSSLTARSITAFRKNDSSGSNNLGGAFTALTFAAVTGGALPAIPASFLPVGRGAATLGVPGTSLVFGFGGVIPFAEVDQEQVSQELQLIGSFDQLEFVLGGFFFNEKVTDTRQTLFSIAYTAPNLRSPVPTNPFQLPFPGQGPTVQSVEATSYALFAQATYSPAFANDQLHLTGGLRYTDDKKTFLRSVAGGTAVNIVRPAFKESRFDPEFTVRYDISPEINVYARYAQAYRAGGVSVRSPNFRPFEAEVNKAYEVGFKSDLLDRRLRLNVALFENRVSNRQVTTQLDPNGNPALVETLNAVGVTRIRGVEMEIIAVPTDGLQFAFNYGYLKGKEPPSYDLLDPNADLRILTIPKHAITASMDYLLPAFSFGQVALHFDYSMASKTPGTIRVPFNNFAFDIDRNVANARASLQRIAIGPADMKLSVFAKNLFDTAYPVFTAPGANAILSAPRTYGIEVGASF